MSSNVDYTVCPKCSALNAAVWIPEGRVSYRVACRFCEYEFEHGHFSWSNNRLHIEAAVAAGVPIHQALTIEEINEILEDAAPSHREDDLYAT